MVNLMSQSDFASGGPWGSGAGTVATGFGELGKALAQGPALAARAGYYGAEAAHARTQTQQLQQQMDIAQGRQDRIKEAMGLLQNPGSLRDPATATRLYSIAMADPELAQHINGLMGGVMALGALGKQYTDAERDKTNAALGIGVSYPTTQSGQTAQLANNIAQIQATGAQNRLTNDNAAVNAVPPGAPPGTTPTTMTQGDAKAKGWTIIPGAEQTEQARPMNVQPAGAAYGTPATVTSQGQATSAPPGTYQAPEPNEVTNVNKPVVVVTPTGPRYTTTGAAVNTGAMPVLGESDATGAITTNTMFPNGPVNLTPPAASNANAPPAAPAPAQVPPVPPPPAQSGQNDTSPPTSDTAQNQTDNGMSIRLDEAENASDTDSGDQPPAPGSNLAALMSGVKMAQASPASGVPGAVLAAGPAAGTPPDQGQGQPVTPPTPPTPPPPSAPAPAQVPPVPAAPTPTPAPTSAVAASGAMPSVSPAQPLAAQGQPGAQPPATQAQPGQAVQPGQLGDAFQQRLDRLRQVVAATKGQAAPPNIAVPPDTGMTPKEELDFGTLIDQSAANRYPQDQTLWHPGLPSEWGPKAYNAIYSRAHDLYTTLGSPTRKNPGMSIQQAEQELEARGQIPPPGYRPAAAPLAQSFGYGRNIVELQAPRQQPGQPGPGQPGQGQGAQAAPPAQPAQPAAQASTPAANQPPTATNAKTGQRYVLVNGQWLEVVNSNQSPAAQAQGQ